MQNCTLPRNPDRSFFPFRSVTDDLNLCSQMQKIPFRFKIVQIFDQGKIFRRPPPPPPHLSCRLCLCNLNPESGRQDSGCVTNVSRHRRGGERGGVNEPFMRQTDLDKKKDYFCAGRTHTHTNHNQYNEALPPSPLPLAKSAIVHAHKECCRAAAFCWH